MLAVAALALSLPSSAMAVSARPTILQAAEALHDQEGLQDGSTTVAECHTGAQPGTVVCVATMRGIVELSVGPVEAECVAAVAAVWLPLRVSGFKVVGAPGMWSPRAVSDTRCEGVPLNG
jgi:hypothetical protein